MTNMIDDYDSPLRLTQDEFIAEWGALGTAWGVNRTMTQIHGLLMISPEPLCTDDIMERLEISRGNAHANLQNLLSWGIIKKVIIKGSRKEHFEAEKDPWKIFCIVARERKRREIEPVLQILDQCIDSTKEMEGDDANTFNTQMKDLREFVEIGNNVLEKIGNAERAHVVKWLLKMLS